MIKQNPVATYKHKHENYSNGNYNSQRRETESISTDRKLANLKLTESQISL